MKPVTEASARRVRRGLRIGGLAAGVLILIVLGVELFRGRRVDACAERLIAAARSKDASFLSAAVRSPSIQAQLAGAARIELGFTRPMSTEWSRVGLVVTSSAAKSAMLVLLLESAPLPECRFLKDYERGAFSAPEGR